MPSENYDALEYNFYIKTYVGAPETLIKLQGEVDGDFFTAAYDNDAISSIEGAKGDVQFSQKVASLGTITYNMQWGSDTNIILNKIFQDQQDGNYLQTGELRRENESKAGVNLPVITCDKIMIQKIPNYNIGSAAGNRGWSFKLSRMKFEQVEVPA